MLTNDYYLLARDAITAIKEGDTAWWDECLAEMKAEESESCQS